MLHLVRNARVLIALGIISGVSISGVIAYTTGVFHRCIAMITGAVDGIVAWINSPLGYDHLVAGLGVLVAPLIAVFIMLALTDP